MCELVAEGWGEQGARQYLHGRDDMEDVGRRRLARRLCVSFFTVLEDIGLFLSLAGFRTLL